MPEKARVFVAEDDSTWQRLIKQLLNDAGHKVILKAPTLAQALKSIDQFQKLGIQVAVIDGNLSEDDSSGYDGRLLAKKIKELAPQVKTIGMSGLTVDGVDINIGKINASKLGKIITNL